MSNFCSPYLFACLKACPEEPDVTTLALRCFYNFCYMCFQSQGYYLEHAEGIALFEILEEIRVGSISNDFDVKRELRRVELSLETDGWRGNVDRIMQEEMEKERKGMLLTVKIE